MVCTLPVKTLHLSYKLGIPFQFLSFHEIFSVVTKDKIYFKGVKNISEVPSTTLKEILPYSGLLLGFRLLKASFISSSVRFDSPMGFDVVLDTGQILFAIQGSLRLVLD